MILRHSPLPHLVHLLDERPCVALVCVDYTYPGSSMHISKNPEILELIINDQKKEIRKGETEFQDKRKAAQHKRPVVLTAW